MEKNKKEIYIVEASRYGDTFARAHVDGFIFALSHARKLACDYPTCEITVINDQRADMNFDGLTEEQREQVEDTIDWARNPKGVAHD